MTSRATQAFGAQSSGFLEAMPPELSDTVAALGVRVAYADGRLIHGPVAPSRAMFRVERGRVRFRSTTFDGDELTVARVGAGHWFGEIALLADIAPPHDAVAEDGCELLRVPGARVLSLLEERPDIAVAFARLSCARLARTYRALDLLRTGRTPELLATILLAECDADGWVRLTQDALCQRIGRSRSAVGPLLLRWQRAGLVETGRGRIRVLEPERLKGLSGP